MNKKKLESWKQIALFLGCSPKTAHRYMERGLPVHYMGGHRLRRVFAFENELTAWVMSGSNQELMDSLNDDMDRPVIPALAASFQLFIVHGQLKGQIFPLSESSQGIGRGADNAIVVPDSDVSRHHVRIDMVGGQGTVVDLSSKNGTFVNDRAVVKPVLLRSGDRLRLGKTLEFLVQDIHIVDTT